MGLGSIFLTLSNFGVSIFPWLPLTHYWIQVLCRVPEALGKGQIALGKIFAGCGTRQRTHGKKLISKTLFAKCILSGTRQRLCRVPRGHSAKKSDRHGAGPVDGHLPSANPAGTRQRFFIFFKKISLPSANPSGTRQRVFIFFTKFLCRVPTFRHSAKIFYFYF